MRRGLSFRSAHETLGLKKLNGVWRNYARAVVSIRSFRSLGQMVTRTTTIQWEIQLQVVLHRCPGGWFKQLCRHGAFPMSLSWCELEQFLKMRETHKIVAHGIDSDLFSIMVCTSTWTVEIMKHQLCNAIYHAFRCSSSINDLYHAVSALTVRHSNK